MSRRFTEAEIAEVWGRRKAGELEPQGRVSGRGENEIVAGEVTCC